MEYKPVSAALATNPVPDIGRLHGHRPIGEIGFRLCAFANCSHRLPGAVVFAVDRY